ncbi:tetratricopeptide repeat protein [Fulvivirga sediminis]|uniref:Tetratricopeptide repeat protein n=2 Tax=Fulvivirga sediminis TaxID=2803949 RepID=A0A937FBT3_9BACT|nr:tetratricopeptide repeat protein [Fulvivirga sediminis]MBL3657673.1 tetratricopeptide repeat protein [Fulvivirga sediminis]
MKCFNNYHILVFSIFYCIMMIACTDAEKRYSTVELPDDVKSLEALLRDDNLTIDSRLSAYYKLSKIFEIESPDLALNYAEKLTSLSIEKESIYFQARGTYMTGLLATNSGNYKEAVNNYIKAAELFEITQENLWQADAINNVGQIFYLIQGYDLAMKYFQKAAKLYEMENDYDYLSLALANIASCYYGKADFDNAEMFYQKAIVIQEESSNETDYKQSNYYQKLGNVYFEQNNYEKALSHYRKALSFTDLTNEFKYSIYLNIANTLNYSFDFANSEKWIDKAAQLESEIRIINAQHINSLNIQGEHYQLKGNHEKALEIFEKAITIADKDVFNEYLINTLDLISKSQRAMAKESAKLSINDIFRIEDIRRQQEKLKAEVIDQLDYKKLQVLLDTEIQNHYKDVKQSEIDKERSTIIKIASACIAIFFFTMLGTTLYIRSKKVTYENKIRRVNDLLNS